MSIGIPIQSLIRQTYDDFEVLIIDDGSKDKTKDIIRELIEPDARFKYFFQDNSGVSAARNRGIKLAKGDLISFLDSDDFYDCSYLEKMVNKMKNTSADVCYCGYNIVSPRRKTRNTTKFRCENLLLDYILGRVSIHTTGWLINKYLIDEFNILFPDGISWGEDFEFFCEVLMRSKKNVYVNEYLTNYRVEFENNRLSSFSMIKMDQDFASVQRIRKKLCTFNNEVIEEALLSYRLQAILVYRLLLAFKEGTLHIEIFGYYEKYKAYISTNSWINGIRSFKLNVNKIYLLIRLFIIGVKTR